MRITVIGLFELTLSDSILVFAHYSRSVAAAEKHSDAPYARKSDKRIDDAGYDSAHAAEYRCDEVELEYAHKAPVERSDDDEYQRKSIHSHYLLSSPLSYRAFAFSIPHARKAYTYKAKSGGIIGKSIELFRRSTVQKDAFWGDASLNECASKPFFSRCVNCPKELWVWKPDFLQIIYRSIMIRYKLSKMPSKPSFPHFPQSYPLI